MAKSARVLRDLAIAVAILVGLGIAAELWAAERARTYSYRDFTTITPHNSNTTIKGCRWIQVTVAGNVTFLHRDGTASDAYPMTQYQTFELGWNHIGVKATGTTATGIFCFWDIDVANGPLS